MKETKYVLAHKQADETVIYVKRMSGEEVERASTYYEAQDYKSLDYARTTRNIYENLKDFDVYRVNIEIYNTEPTREEERQKKIDEENKAEVEVVEPEVVPEETEKAEELNEAVEDTKEADADTAENKETSNEEKPVEETKGENTEITEENNKGNELDGSL